MYRHYLAPPRQSARCLLALASLVTVPALRAQTLAPAANVNNEEVVVLSPFVVEASEDKGYTATNTLAGTRIRTELKDVGSAISVVTEAFLKDTGARNNEDLLVYVTNSEVAGGSGNFVGFQGAGNETGSLLRPDTNTRVRGLGAADNTRDFFLTDLPWDSYNVGRIDLQRGPNMMLFGIGKPAGIINASVNTARYTNEGTVETRFDGTGSVRASLDLNRVLIKDQLAVRLDVLRDHKKFEQKPAYNNDHRIFGALKFEPAMLNKNGNHTSLRASYEHGDIEANRPRTAPPTDLITQWFTGMNRGVYDATAAANYQPAVPGSGASGSNNPTYQPWLGTMYGGNFLFFEDPANGASNPTAYIGEVGRALQFGIRSDGTIDRSIGGIPYTRPLGINGLKGWANNTTQAFSNDYKDLSLTDPSIFDFYHKLLEGPNKREVRNFEAANAALSQTFLNNRIGIELAYDHQLYTDAQDAVNQSAAITVDVNTSLTDGSLNPNVGRPMLVSRTTYGCNGSESERTAMRATVFGELRATDFLKKGLLTDILGRHVFTGMASSDTYEKESKNWVRYASGTDFGSFTGLGPGFDPGRELQIVSYIGPDMRGITTPAGLNLTNITTVQTPRASQTRVFDSRWKQPINPSNPGYVNPAAVWVNPFWGSASTESENPANYTGWVTTPTSFLDSLNGDRESLMKDARKTRQKLSAKAFIWQGFFFNGNVVPTFGYREDTAKSFTTTAPTGKAGNAERSSPLYVYPEQPNSTLTGVSRSWSLVGHLPKSLRKYVPGHLGVSVFFNQSSNFEPAAGRVDVLNRPLPAPDGKTKDYGFVVSALEGKLNLKVNWYESSANGASYNLSNLYFIGSVESRAWVAAKRFQAGLTGAPEYAGTSYNYGNTVNGVFVQTPEELALQQAHVAAVLANVDPSIWEAWHFQPTDERWQKAWWDPWSGTQGGLQPNGLTGTVDTMSKGTEYELSFEPTSNWSVVVNASKTSATRTNILGNLREWIEGRNAVWQSIAGDIRMWSGNGTDSINKEWNSSFYNNYTLQTLLSGSNVTELRPWKANVISTYRFIEGFLKGVNVGGALRWQDRVAIGYKSISATVNGKVLNTYDIENPVYGPSDTKVDLWLGYERKLTEHLNWRIQLNVRNVLGKNELIPTGMLPDGTFATYSIREGLSWTVTNSFKF